MAMRQPNSLEKAHAESVINAWPYPAFGRTLTVQKDGSVRIRASFVRMIAEGGDEVKVVFYSDGHIEVDGVNGRAGPPSSVQRGQVFEDDAAFFAELDARIDQDVPEG